MLQKQLLSIVLLLSSVQNLNITTAFEKINAYSITIHWPINVLLSLLEYFIFYLTTCFQ